MQVYITLQLQITLQVHVMACHITDTTHHGGVTSLAVTLTVTVGSRHITVDLQINRHVICHGGWQVAVQSSHGKPYSRVFFFFFFFFCFGKFEHRRLVTYLQGDGAVALTITPRPGQ